MGANSLKRFLYAFAPLWLNKPNRVLLSLFFLFLPFCVSANTVFNSNCRTSLYHILYFDFEKAQTNLTAERRNNPANLFIPYLENYIDFLQVAFTESPEDIQRYKQTFLIRLNTISQSKEFTPYKKYFLTEINLQASIVFAKINMKYKAVKYLYAAQKNLVENQKLYPDFSMHNKHLPVILLVNSYLPQIIKSLVPITSKPDKAFDLLQKYRNDVVTDSVLKLESDILWAFLLYQFGGNPKEVSILLRPVVRGNNNMLLFFAFSLNAIRSGTSTEALNMHDNIKVSKNSSIYLFFQYIQGELSLYTQLDGCNSFEYFVHNYKGNNYLKTAWLKLGWSYLIKGDTIKYLKCKENVKRVGKSWNDSDGQALREVTDNTYPNIFLLKARILFDGGLYQKSRKSLLAGEALKSLVNQHDQIEYLYRFARINHAENDYLTAKKYYAQVIQLGRDAPYYFAANSALQLGLIYELESNLDQSVKYFALCLTLNRFGYSESIGTKAKAGLKRVARN